MKLVPTTPTPPAEGQTPKKTSGKTTGGFQQVLETAIGEKTAPSGAPTRAHPVAVPSIPGLDAAGAMQAASGVQRMERFIDALDAYQQRLADPRCPLRDIATAVERLESEQRHLERLSESASLDQTLGTLVNEGLVTATLEIHRFRSGAYF